MGIVARIVVYAPADSIARPAVAAAFERIAQLEDVFSNYRPTSEIGQLQRVKFGAAVAVSPDLLAVMLQADRLWRASDGAFDPTVGPLADLWRASQASLTLPSAAAVDRARDRTGWLHVRIDSVRQVVTLGRDDLSLDFGGIAKGYAGDEALIVLRSRGVTQALVELGGDIVVGDPPPGTKGWVIDGATFGATYGADAQLVLANQAVSTSGDSQQFVEIDGIRYSHIVDPRTGRGLTDSQVVTIIAESGLIADGLSTAVSVLGEAAGRRVAQAVSPTARVFFRPAG